MTNRVLIGLTILLILNLTACGSFTIQGEVVPPTRKVESKAIVGDASIEKTESTDITPTMAFLPESCPQIDETTGTEIAVKPCPGGYLACDDLSPGMMLEDIAVETSTCKRDYINLDPASEGIGRAGDPCLLIHGRIRNERGESYYVAIWASGDDSTGNAVSRTLDCAHTCGQGLVAVGGSGVKDFTLHLNYADDIRFINIHSRCYSTPPP
jgi:hypothetical protein